ncbi:hypothetical protein [Candidatus Clavichlamydia salmonicola]|uniref:hypothetical protein n=1 Tax=Candidatus Clavichlamydia salmonicola TaxID=469812 RepID=UPI0018910D78|nr:hypothetical protein [Candidatus Clavichlamydia salmonicola]
MINLLNTVFLGRLGVRFPATTTEAYANVKWKLSMLNRVSQVAISSSMGLLGLFLENRGCFAEHQPLTSSSAVSTTLIIPIKDSTEGIKNDLVLRTTSSLLTSTVTYTTGASTTILDLSKMLSIITVNATNGVFNDTISLINSTSQAKECFSGIDHCLPIYCLPMIAIKGLLEGVLFVWTLVKMVRRCRGSGEGGRFAQLVVIGDILLLGASGLGFSEDVLWPACYPSLGTPNLQVCTALVPMVLVSSILYFTHAGVLVLSALCADRSVKIIEPAVLEEGDICLSEIPGDEAVSESV